MTEASQPARSARTMHLFFGAFTLAFLARALLVLAITRGEGCSLAEYARSADGYQAFAMAAGWRGDLEAVREQVFYKMLRESGGLASSHLIRFFPAGSGLLALGLAAGLPLGVAATIPFWLVAALAAGLAAVWANDGRVGALVATVPPIALYASSFTDSWGWLVGCVVGGLALARRGNYFAAGVALGLAGWARPEGLFAAAGLWIALVVGRAWRALSRLSGGVALAVACGTALVVARFGPLLAEIAAGGGASATGAPAFLDLPGRALWQGFSSPTTPTWKLIYVGAHLAVVAASLLLLTRHARRADAIDDKTEATALALWLALQVALVLFLRGGQGFDDLPRLTASCAPAIVAALLPWLPKGRWPVALLCVSSVVVAYVPAQKNARPECGSMPGVSTRLETRMPAGSDAVVGGDSPGGLPRT